MMRLSNLLLAAAALLFAAPAAAQEAEPAPAPAPSARPAPSGEDIARASRILALFTNALEAESVPLSGKRRYLACMYHNSLGDISVATGRLIAQDATLDNASNVDLMTAASRVCGININVTGGDADTPTSDR